MSRDFSMLAAIGFAILALFAAGGAIGYMLASVRAGHDLVEAQTEAGICQATVQSQHDALTTLQQRIDKQQADALAAQARADAARTQRDKTVIGIQKRAADTVAAIREQGHEDADSASLARLPVPTALAWRLWPSAAASAGAATNH